MKYDFTSVIERRGMDAIAVDAVGSSSGPAAAPGGPKPGFDVIPMWVADMNFPTVPTIQEAVAARLAHPCFGYFAPSDDYFNSIIRWQSEQNGVTGLTREAIGYENGVLGALASALMAFTAPGEKFLMHSPTYIGFTHVAEDTGRTPELSPMKRDENGVWRMDYADMDARLKREHIHFAVFCSPHNPCGRVWEPWEIEKAMEVYKANDVIVFSDEIWSDLTLNGSRHTPTQSVSEDAKMRTIALYAPSKTFNLAGLIGSYHIVYNPYLRDRLFRSSEVTHYNDMNVLSMHALIGAYKPEGQEWLRELREVLSGNINYAYDFITKHFSGVTAAMPQGTYMMYLNCEGYCRRTGKTMDELLRAGWDVGVAYQDGRPFHDPYSIRMNFALPRARVEEAMERLRKYVFCE